MRRLLRVLAAASLGAAACTGGSSTSPPLASPAGSPGASASPASPWQHGDPAQLVAAWKVEVPGSSDHASLVIGDAADGGLALFDACGLLQGDFRASPAGMFIGYLFGGSDACDIAAAAPWMRKVVAFRLVGQDAQLLDRQGRLVATLLPGAHPTTGPDASPDFARGRLTQQLRESFASPPELPSGITAVSAARVVGRWVPLHGSWPRPAFVSFATDGKWSGSDGCNGAGGTYVLGPDGLFLATSGPSTLVGCNNAPLASWPAQSRRIGIEKGQLVFTGPDGKVLGRARRPA